MSETLSVADVLRKALEAFGPNGENWAKGRNGGLHDYTKKCASLAISDLGVDYELVHDARSLLCGSIGANGIETSAIYRWNDAPERTFAEVKALFEKAIAKAGTQ